MKKRLFRSSEVVTIKDALGLQWDINEARATKYGFDLYYGKKKDRTGYDVGGPNRLIYTNELKAFWEKCAISIDGTIFDLPAGRTTLKRRAWHWALTGTKIQRSSGASTKTI